MTRTRYPVDPLESFGEFQKEVSDWAKETFPNETPASKIAHLRREVEELAETPGDTEEMADCFILLLGLCEKAGGNLLAAAKRKMEINRERKWGEPDEDGVCSHISEPLTKD